MIFCEQSFLSVGGGDGHYGLWLDDTFERGISSPWYVSLDLYQILVNPFSYTILKNTNTNNKPTSPTFGNESLSDEGEKFDILGVEIWSIGTDI